MAKHQLLTQSLIFVTTKMRHTRMLVTESCFKQTNHWQLNEKQIKLFNVRCSISKTIIKSDQCLQTELDLSFLALLSHRSMFEFDASSLAQFKKFVNMNALQMTFMK